MAGELGQRGSGGVLGCPALADPLTLWGCSPPFLHPGLAYFFPRARASASQDWGRSLGAFNPDPRNSPSSGKGRASVSVKILHGLRAWTLV